MVVAVALNASRSGLAAGLTMSTPHVKDSGACGCCWRCGMAVLRSTSLYRIGYNNVLYSSLADASRARIGGGRDGHGYGHRGGEEGWRTVSRTARHKTLAAPAESSAAIASWRTPLESTDLLGPPIVALGKFDALHRGHQKLAITAAHLGGTPYLISFDNMADVLGWEPRLPLVATCDRPRVLASWKKACLGMAPREHGIPFAEVRSLSPEDFVAVLAEDLGAKGVVVGSNYRFGYKAAGTAETLKRLGKDYGMKVEVVNLVEREQASLSRGIGGADEICGIYGICGIGDTVSSSVIRQALKAGNMAPVAECLGRAYRVVGVCDGHGRIPCGAFLNQYPAPGEYDVMVGFASNAQECAGEVDMRPGRAVFDEAGATIEDGAGGPSDRTGLYCILEFTFS